MQFDQLKRRDFITLVGGAAAAWPVAARAQQPPKTSKVGILYPGMAAALPLRVAGFREGLRAGGYRETDNIELLSRAADGDPTRIARLAMELAGRKVDVMVPVSPAAVHAALAASALLELNKSNRGSPWTAISRFNRRSRVLMVGRPYRRITTVIHSALPAQNRSWFSAGMQAFPAVARKPH
jgi:hypothetical protein